MKIILNLFIIICVCIVHHLFPVLVLAEQKEKGADYIDPITGMQFVKVKGGCYQMGDTFYEHYNDPSKPVPVHEVCLDDFYIGKYEVSQEEWKKNMGSNPSKFNTNDNNPVEMVSWNDAQKFIGKLNSKTGGKFRLPTEAEWEYACREGGKKIKFGTGKNLISADEANYDGGSIMVGMTSMKRGIARRKTVPVDSFAPNALGLYNMSGNVWEWTADYYSDTYYKESPRDNPKGPLKADRGAEHVVRGGSWAYNVDYLRCAFRKYYEPYVGWFNFGFRVARTP